MNDEQKEAMRSFLSMQLLNIASSSELDAFTVCGIVIALAGEYAASCCRHSDVTKDELVTLFSKAFDGFTAIQQRQFGRKH